MEIDAPVRFSPQDDVETLVQKRLYIQPETSVRFAAEGKMLAKGLAKFLRWCFFCHADASLAEQGDELSCNQCKNTWRVTAENQLHLQSSVSEVISVKAAWASVRTHLSQSWGTSPQCESLSDVTLYDATRREWQILKHGKLSLKNQRLMIDDFSLEMKDVLTHTMDWGNLILIRTARKRLALKMPHESRAIWTHALNVAIEKLNHAV